MIDNIRNKGFYKNKVLIIAVIFMTLPYSQSALSDSVCSSVLATDDESELSRKMDCYSELDLLDDAFRLVKKMSEDEDPDAWFYLGLLYSERHDTEEHKDMAAHWLIKAYEAGRIDAGDHLGEVYSNVPSIYGVERIRKWLGKESKYALSKMGINSISAKDLELIFHDQEYGIKWIKRQSETNSVEFKILMSKIMLHGVSTQKDEKEALGFIKHAVKLGSFKSKFILSYYYLNGIGTKKDAEKSKRWMREGIEEYYRVTVGNKVK